MSAAESRFASEEYFKRELSTALAEGFAVSQEQGTPGLFREVLVFRPRDGAARVLVRDEGVPPNPTRALVVCVLALLAFLVVVLVHGPAYARGTKARAPLGLPSDGAHDQRGTSSMASKKTSPRVARRKTTETVALQPTAGAPDKALGALLSAVLEASTGGDLARVRVALASLNAHFRPALAAFDRERWVRAFDGSTSPGELRLRDRFIASGTETETYFPRWDEHGMIAARIADGEAQIPWADVHEDLEDSDFSHGQGLIRTVVEAFQQGNREVLDRLDDARAFLAGDPRKKGERLLAYLSFIERAVERTHELDAKARNAHDLAQPIARILILEIKQDAFRLRNALARYIDPAFETLDPHELYEALLSVPPPKAAPKNAEGRTKGGRGRRSVASLAAQLAAKAGAFGIASGGEAKLVKELHELRSKAEGGQGGQAGRE